MASMAGMHIHTMRNQVLSKKCAAGRERGKYQRVQRKYLTNRGKGKKETIKRGEGGTKTSGGPATSNHPLWTCTSEPKGQFWGRKGRHG